MSSVLLTTCFNLISSSKITVRRKAADNLRNLLEKDNSLDSVEDSQEFGQSSGGLPLNVILNEIFSYLVEEAECLNKEEREKKSIFANHRNQAQRTLYLVLRSTGLNEYKLPVTNLLKHIFVSFERPLVKRYFGIPLLNQIASIILPKPSYLGLISEKHWLNILQIHKEYLESHVASMQMVFESAPLHKMSAMTLREEFAFVTQICNSLCTDMTRNNQANIVKLVLQFTENTSADCRITCCNMSEVIFLSLINIYDTLTTDANTQNDLNRLFYTQVILHHARGAFPPITATTNTQLGGNQLFCAGSWFDWRRCLHTLHLKVTQRIESRRRRMTQRPGSYSYGNGLSNGDGAGLLVDTELYRLLVEVSRQVFDSGNSDVSRTSPIIELDCTVSSNKRARVDNSLSALVYRITTYEDWPWIVLLDQYLRRYPTDISWDDFESLVQKLSNLLLQDNDNTCHVSACLVTLIDVEHQFQRSEDQAEVRKLQIAWTRIWESTLRLVVGSKKYPECTHRLLDKLLISKCSSHSELFKLYFDNLIVLSPFSVQTLTTACENFTITDSNKSSQEDLRKKLLNWILAGNKAGSILTDPIVAQLLVNLTLKQWPNGNKKLTTEDQIHLEELETIYELNSFTKLLPVPACTLHLPAPDSVSLISSENHHLVMNESLTHLYQSLLRLCNVLEDESDFTVNVNSIILLLNVLSILIKYNIIEEANLDDNEIGARVIRLLQNLPFDLEETSKQMQYKYVVDLRRLFKMNLVDAVQLFFKRHVPLQLLIVVHQIFTNQNIEVEHESSEHTTFRNKTQVASLEVFASFAFWHCVKAPNQEFAGSTLLDFKFDVVANSLHYELVKVLLSAVVSAKVGELTNEHLNGAITIAETTRNCKYSEYGVACFILQFLHDLFPHLAKSDSEQQNKSILLLYEFYRNRKNYGPKVSMLIIKCIETIWELDPTSSWAYWDNAKGQSKVVLMLPVFLNDDQVIVRYSAINGLIVILKNRTNFNYDIFNVQQELLERVISESMEVFTVEGDLSPEQILDETATRTATVLHTFCSIIVYSNIWRKRALVEFLKIVYEKKLISDSLSKILQLVALNEGCNNSQQYLQKYESYLLLQWDKMKLSLINFPYALFGYDSLCDILVKHINLTFPLLMQRQYSQLLQDVCSTKCKSIDSLSRDAYPDLRSFCLMVECGNSNSNIFKDDIQRYDMIKSCLTNLNIIELDVDKIDSILIKLLEYLFDVEHLNSTYKLELNLPKPDRSFILVADFNAIKSKLEESLGETSLGIYLLSKSPDKLQHILLKLKSNIYEANNFNEKTATFHAYALYTELIADHLKSPQSAKMRNYVVRELVHTFLNLMESFSTNFNSSLHTLCVRHFVIILNKILPLCRDPIHEHVSAIVNKCVRFICDDGNKYTKHPCLEILDCLIIENYSTLKAALLLADPLPNLKVFQKYSFVTVTCTTPEEAITYFLNGGSRTWHENDCRVEGIKTLRKALSSNRDGLSQMYDNLSNMSGFSEDCDRSLIHRLICALIRYSTSSDNNTSLEAARCLGELGARDLTTIILKSQKRLPSCGTSYKQFTYCVIALLFRYQIDENIEVVVQSNEALYRVLDSIDIIDTTIDYGCGKIRKSYLIPFSTKSTRKFGEPLINAPVYLDTVTTEVWCPQQPIKHDKWIKSLVTALLQCFINDGYFRDLLKLVELKLSFAEQILPVLVNLLVTCNDPNVYKNIGKNIQEFFHRHAELNCGANAENQDSVSMQKDAVKCMLGVVHFLRLEKMNRRKNSIDFRFNYLEMALAAQYCSAYFTAILYAELWCYESKADDSDQAFDQKMTIFEETYSGSTDVKRKILETVFLESYSALDESDAVACFNLTFLSNRSRDIDIYKDYLLDDSTVNISTEDMTLWYTTEDTMDFDALWRMGKWENGDDKACPFSKKYFTVMKALSDDNKPGFLLEIANSRQLVIDAFKQISLECTNNVYKYLAHLQSINEIEEMASSADNEAQSLVVERWQKDGLQSLHDYKYVEQIQLQRIMMSSIMMKKSNSNLKSALVQLHLDLAQLTRCRGLLPQTIKILRKLRTVPSISNEDLTRIRFEDVQIFWLKNKETGSFLLQDFLKNHSEDSVLRSLGLKLYGTWIAELGALDTQTVIKEYFLKSIQVLNNSQENKESIDMIIEAYDVLARFADEEYQRSYTYTKSTNFELKKKGMNKLKAKADALAHSKIKTERTAYVVFVKQSEIDACEIKNTLEQMNSFLLQSTKYYIHNLVHCEKYNIRIFRVVSMWLENKNNDSLTQKMSESLSAVSSYKYLSILPQLTPHIDSVEIVFKTEILSILERCATGHPHHTLPLILSLCNANKDDQYPPDPPATKSKGSRTATAKQPELPPPDPRSEAAQKLLAKLRKQPKLRELVPRMEAVCDAIIELAYVPVSSTEGPQKLSLPFQSKLRKITGYEDVALPTCNIPFSVTKDYEKIVGIQSFSSDYYTVGGINQPKKISIKGTDGIVRQTLVKGKDDMRQDAVMQQVFNIMNDLFRANKETSKLVVRTYKVVPLSKRSGILEWVKNASALSLYLQKTHGTYSSVSLNTCRQRYRKVADRPTDEKLNTFKEICKQLSPVFHRFFVNTFLDSAIWYERRRAYITSVAVSSMCGYVLGVGDRHVTNILIDEKTAEVIHIDFGIAFEQGRLLPTPETVPFRLTREIVDGMGVTGTAGVFRRSCEKTLSVLRMNMETILAILEVLLYDPMYMWTITPEQAYSKQLEEGDNEALPLADLNDDNVNVTAERVLLRIRDKLMGKNDKTLEGQVLKLINQARDPANLCRLFYGWQPYL